MDISAISSWIGLQNSQNYPGHTCFDYAQSVELLNPRQALMQLALAKNLETKQQRNGNSEHDKCYEPVKHPPERLTGYKSGQQFRSKAQRNKPNETTQDRSECKNPLVWIKLVGNGAEQYDSVKVYMWVQIGKGCGCDKCGPKGLGFSPRGT